MTLSVKRVSTALAAILWSVFVGWTIVTTGGKAILGTIVVCLTPAVILFLYTILTPTRLVVAIRAISAIVAGLLYYRSLKTTPLCSGDGFCGTDVYVAMIADVAVFGVLRPGAALFALDVPQKQRMSSKDVHEETNDVIRARRSRGRHFR